MKERPILFSAPMVRAILDGRKTVTRRVVKSKPFYSEAGCHPWKLVNWGNDNWTWYSSRCGDHGDFIKCPLGVSGDRLWVQETWACVRGEPHNLASGADTVYYRCDKNSKVVPHNKYAQECDGQPVKWRPSIHMPRWISRINLEIIAVRVELLQDISMEDCRAEGVANFGGLTYADPAAYCPDPWEVFSDLWNSINGKKHPWDSNPWVWVIEFKGVKP